MSQVISGSVYVVKDNIDTDQIISAQYLTLVPTIPDEYQKLGSYAMAGLPESSYPIRYIEPGQMKTKYPIVLGGRNFGCGSSREHAPIAMGAAGCKAVVAESYARIYFRNCIATGELYPCETTVRLIDRVKTGDVVEIDLDANEIRTPEGTYRLKPLGEAKPVIDAGGIFNYARQSGLIAAAPTE